MIKKIITLFKLGRKIAKSNILNIVSKFKEPPVVIKIIFNILSFSFSNKQNKDENKDQGEKLSSSLESMGTTFIKLGQFLATRPDIIGEELSKKLESLQDKLPPFPLHQAKEIIRNDLGNDNYNSIMFFAVNSPSSSLIIFSAKDFENGGNLSCNFSKFFVSSSPMISGLVAKNCPSFIKVVPKS